MTIVKIVGQKQTEADVYQYNPYHNYTIIYDLASLSIHLMTFFSRSSKHRIQYVMVVI